MNTKQYAGGYRIIYDSPKLKQQSAVASECECPVCRMNENIKITPMYADEKTIQNTYECQNCGTVWKGNLYDEGWNPAKKNSTLAKKALLAAAYILAFIILGRISDFIFLFEIGIGIIAGISFAIAGAIDYSMENKKKNTNMARFIFLANLLIIIGVLV